jgi:hypothetical protein
MTYQRHWLLSWGGTLATRRDIWANNVRFMNRETGSSDSIGPDRMETLLDDFVGDIRAWVTNLASYHSNQVQVTWVKFNEIGPDGRYVDQTTTHARYLSGTSGDFPVINGTSTNPCPAYQSVCITTTTDVERGPGSKGRLFIPQCSVPLDSFGQISTANLTQMAAAAASFFTDLGNEPSLDVTAVAPHVVSNVGNPGPARRITGVKVGDVPDIISRRKNNIREVYQSATVSTG